MIPQLMPLMWISSVLMSLIILIVLMEMYYYNNYNVNKLSVDEGMIYINFKW